jgi:subtilisin family serine protease
VAVDPGWRRAIHLAKRSAAGIVIGMADSGVDDDRLAPRQAPTLHLSAGGKATPHDPRGHGTEVASILVANRPELGVVGIVPDATLLSARIVKSKACNQAVLVDGLVAALGWLRKQGAQVVNISATAKRSRALVD